MRKIDVFNHIQPDSYFRHVQDLDAAKQDLGKRTSGMLPLRAGAQVVLGARRLHVLPTPISSFLACAPTEAEAAELAKEPLLESLSTRMKTRVGLRAIDGLTGAPEVFAGVAAISGGDSAAPTVEWLFQHGAGEVLVLPRNAPSPTRVYIHWTDEAVRRTSYRLIAEAAGIVPGN